MWTKSVKRIGFEVRDTEPRGSGATPGEIARLCCGGTRVWRVGCDESCRSGLLPGEIAQALLRRRVFNEKERNSSLDGFASSAPGFRGVCTKPVGGNSQRMWRSHYSAPASDVDVVGRGPAIMPSRVFTHGHARTWLCRDRARSAVPSCFSRIGF